MRLFESFGKKLGAIKTRVDRLELIREIRGERCENVFSLPCWSHAKRKVDSLGDCFEVFSCHNLFFCVFCVLELNVGNWFAEIFKRRIPSDLLSESPIGFLLSFEMLWLGELLHGVGVSPKRCEKFFCCFVHIIKVNDFC